MSRLVLGPLALLALLASLLSPLGGPAAPTAAAAADPARVLPPSVNLERPEVRGTPRYGETLRATRGRWRPGVDAVRYQWLRDGRPIKGATRPLFEIRPMDVEHRLGVAVSVRSEGHRWTTARATAVRALHAVPVRRTATYVVRVKGRPGVRVAAFQRLAQQTFDDPRGWRARGVRFVRVQRGGAFTLWISEAGLVPSFSSECSVQWSCRVGRNVVINAVRWQHASPAWNRGGESLRDYRHMVVNHETGHWLGFGHASCPARGALAPVMMQQSKGTDGCRFNPWPTAGELGRARTTDEMAEGRPERAGLPVVQE